MQIRKIYVKFTDVLSVVENVTKKDNIGFYSRLQKIKYRILGKVLCCNDVTNKSCNNVANNFFNMQLNMKRLTKSPYEITECFLLPPKFNHCQAIATNALVHC